MAEGRAAHDEHADMMERIMQAHMEALDRSLAEPTVNQDAVQKLFSICSTGTLSELQVALKDPTTSEAALAIQEYRTGYIKRKLYNLKYMVERACEAGSATIVQFLLEFAQTHDIPPSQLIERETVHSAISSNNLSIFAALAACLPAVIEYDLGPGGGLPIDKTLGSLRDGRPLGDSRIPLLAFLLEHGADVNKSGLNGMNRLCRAAGLGSLNATGLLLRHGAAISGSGGLQNAASGGRIDVLDILLEHGADVNEVLGDKAAAEWYSRQEDRENVKDMTALQFAVREGQHEAVEWLNQHGAVTQADRIVR